MTWSRIEYSVVVDAAEQKKWEDFYLDEHERKYGLLPTRHNKRRERSA